MLLLVLYFDYHLVLDVVSEDNCFYTKGMTRDLKTTLVGWGESKGRKVGSIPFITLNLVCRSLNLWPTFTFYSLFPPLSVMVPSSLSHIYCEIQSNFTCFLPVPTTLGILLTVPHIFSQAPTLLFPPNYVWKMANVSAVLSKNVDTRRTDWGE